MIRRFITSAGLAAIVTFGLFLLMQLLIATSEAKLDDKDLGRVVDFVRVKRSESMETKKRQLPQRQAAQDQPAPPKVSMQNKASAGDVPVIPIQAPDLDRSVQVQGGPHLGAAPSDTDIIPLVRVQPIYPRAAAERQLEGWVQIQFTISTTGTVKDPAVIAAEPPNVFERAALQAISKWKYRPRIDNGKPVETPGVRVQLTFTLDDL